MLSTGFVVIHDALVSRQDNLAELTGWEDSVREVLEVPELEIEVRGDHTALVESSVEVHNDLSATGIVDDLEFTDVSMRLHHSEELDQGLGDWSKDNLKQRARISTQIPQVHGGVVRACCR